VQAVVRSILAELPDASVLLLGLPPRGEADTSPWRLLVKGTDQLLAVDHGDATYMDVGDDFLQSDGTLRAGMLEPAEFLHPTAAGYDVLGRAVAPAVRSLLG
jgi:hypothetical protein